MAVPSWHTAHPVKWPHPRHRSADHRTGEAAHHKTDLALLRDPVPCARCRHLRSSRQRSRP
jgi:hypothetical protein